MKLVHCSRHWREFHRIVALVQMEYFLSRLKDVMNARDERPLRHIVLKDLRMMMCLWVEMLSKSNRCHSCGDIVIQ